MALPLAVDAAALLPRPFRVQRATRELADTWTLELVPRDGGGAIAFEPGQFNMLYAFGVGESAISISGDPQRPAVLVHTVRAVGAVTRALCGLRRDQTVGVRGPFGAGWPLELASGKDVLVMAGGIGLAPLRPAILDLLARRARFGRVTLLVGARTPDDLLYARQLERWRARFDLDVRVTVDSAGQDWRGEVGVVTKLTGAAQLDPRSATALVCGPEVMMRFAAQALLARGLPPEAIFVSLERNMRCAVGICGHCQFGPEFVCSDGPVFPYARVAALLQTREV